MSEMEPIGVLVAEDEYFVAEMIKGMLREAGYRIAGEACDGQEAARMTEQRRPDVVLMDIAMPGMDGLRAAREIQDRCPTPIVMLTAHDSPALVEQASQAGAGAYLVKPPKAGEIERAIAIARARFRDMAELRRLNDELRRALDNVKQLKGLLPICASCKKIRNDEGQWSEIEVYIRQRSEAQFSHGLCPDCAKKLYKDYYSGE
ncbi:MAG: putative transcriptional regulatory protein pdtaR [candidate division BRC1 bacterium ADurb.BinA364]|nr:MAG: putative transcriptional regulatory protein pdtaR [candidate division BRC1 bacterium ADurb.BinA364]